MEKSALSSDLGLGLQPQKPVRKVENPRYKNPAVRQTFTASVKDKRLTVQQLCDIGQCRFREVDGRVQCRRYYTLTHNDMTGNLLLSVGNHFNLSQVAGVWTRMLRDEVLAWWDTPKDGIPCLHVKCHVSGEQLWPLPASFRDTIFLMDMPLVLECILKGDSTFINQKPSLLSGRVEIHLQSHKLELNRSLFWGHFGFQDTWRTPPAPVEDFVRLLCTRYTAARLILKWLVFIHGQDESLNRSQKINRAKVATRELPSSLQ
eukprot:TRINITY_DN1488_c0_g1_i1.p3 TRINITY_DN1488_c0_g1~~TRINITY_DN1488_c0_g1_i1.p3  ORF type:complete len:261 (+),score=14.14 TRINITY_DN1488_c0_g1_i1:154-936(+)